MGLFCAVECPLNGFGRTVSVSCLEPTVNMIVELFAFESPSPEERS